MPVQYPSDPMQSPNKPLAVPPTNQPAVMPAVMPSQQPQQQALQQTPGGQYGNISGNRYNTSTNQSANSSNNWAANANPHPVNTNPATNANATQWNTNFGPVDTSVENFRQFGDQYYSHTMDRMRPDIDARNEQLAQTLINRGLREGSSAWNAEMDRMTRGNNDLMSATAVQAEQLGLAAQNQNFGQQMQNNQFGLAQNQQNYGQQFGYDQLANALAQSRIGANASMASAAASSAAARYAADQQNYRADLSHQLGTNQLNETGRQFDINNILATNGQNQNFLLGALGQYGNFMNMGMNQFGQQQQANDAWYNQAGQMANNAPGVIFNPNQNYTSNQINANANHVNAIGNDNQMAASFLGGMIPMSDKRVKENIVKVGRENGINIYEFDYIDKRLGEGRYSGVMAQEIKGKYPDAIHYVGDYMAVDYSKLPVNMRRVA